MSRPFTEQELATMRADVKRVDEVFAGLSGRQKLALHLGAVYSSIGWRATSCISSLRLIGALVPRSTKLSPLGMMLRKMTIDEDSRS